MSLWKHATHSPGLAVSLAAALLLAPAAAAQSARAPASPPARARAAKTINVNDTGHLHLANPSSTGETLVEEGRATGTLPGSVRASLTVSGSTVRVIFTIHLRGGSITGRGTAKFNAGQREYASFGGSIVVNHGSGHYRHAVGSGHVYGTINRNTDDATVQVIGQLHL